MQIKGKQSKGKEDRWVCVLLAQQHSPLKPEFCASTQLHKQLLGIFARVNKRLRVKWSQNQKNRKKDVLFTIMKRISHRKCYLAWMRVHSIGFEAVSPLEHVQLCKCGTLAPKTEERKEKQRFVHRWPHRYCLCMFLCCVVMTTLHVRLCFHIDLVDLFGTHWFSGLHWRLTARSSLVWNRSSPCLCG